MTLDEHGAVHLPGAAAPLLSGLDRIAAAQPQDRAGVRLQGVAGLAEAIAPLARLAGPAMVPVRAILFDKSAAANWALGWHQDRTIVVRERAAVKGFGPWSVKQGMTHVEPPFVLLERMITVRVHLDPVDGKNAPLLVAPGSHRRGRIAEQEVEAVVGACGTFACLAERGDLWAYATPILHASAAAIGARRRRMLQIDFSADELPVPLAWLGL